MRDFQAAAGAHNGLNTMPSDHATPFKKTASQPLEEAVRALEAPASPFPLLSQRGFLNIVHQEIDWVARSGESSLLLMLQRDHASANPDAQAAMAHVLRSCLRAQDHVGLIDHQVFGVVLHDCQADQGLQVAQRMLRQVQDLPLPALSQPSRPITTSIGAAFAPLWVRSEVSVWMARVLAQLMAAQSRGGNCICVDSRYLSALSTQDAAGQYLSASTIEFRAATGLHGPD